MTITRHAAAIALLLLPVGCASVPPKGGFDDVAQQTGDRIGHRVVWNQGTAEDAEAAAATSELLTHPLDADSAVQVALFNNRQLQATYEDLGVTQAALVRAGLLKNPRFSGSYTPPIDGGASSMIGLELAQDFLDVFFLDARKRIAEAEFEAVKVRVAEAVLDIAGRTRAAFLDAQAAGQMMELRQTIADAAAASHAAADRLYAAGNITALELAQELVASERAKLGVADAQRAVLMERERLNRLMGLWGPIAGAWKIEDRMADPDADGPALDGVERRAIEANLSLAAQRAEVEVASRRAGLARWSSVLDEIEVGVAADREDDGAWFVGPSLSLQLPIFDQGQPEKAKTAAELRRALNQYAATAVDIRSTARTARDRLTLAHRAAIFHRDTVLPLEDQIVEHTQLQYNAMQVGVFELLQAKAGQVDAATEYLHALHEYHLARAQLDMLLAGLASVDRENH